MNSIWIGLEIMGKGMAGIFVSTLLIIGVVYLLTKITSRRSDKPQSDKTDASS